MAHLNPFFYSIDGFRYGFLGRHDGDLTLGLFITLGVNVGLWLLAYRMVAVGYKLKP